MENPKFRKTLITLHLLFAAFLTPSFLMLALTGGNYLSGIKGSFEKTPLSLASNAQLDFKKDDDILKEDIIKLLEQSNITHKFEYVKNRGKIVQLRPTSRKYLELEQTPGGLKASWVQPSFQAGMMELHKGHGPTLFKTYQKFVALGLLLVVLGGFLVGLLSKVYRRRTIITMILGTILFALLMNA